MTDYANYVRVTKEWHEDARENGKADFGLLDKRNRAIGYVWSITPVTITALTAEEQDKYCYLYLPEDIGERFELRIHVTKNGRTFGASNGSKLFATIEAARASAQKSAEGARKRYAAKPQEKR